jgi:uncharacterized protein YbjT (DUF2867 family)
VALDIANGTPSDFASLLSGIDAVVNCAGILQDAPGESTEGVHHRGVAALIDACASQGVHRLVHVSAAGVERETTSFSATKHAGDARVIARPIRCCRAGGLRRECADAWTGCSSPAAGHG